MNWAGEEIKRNWEHIQEYPRKYSWAIHSYVSVEKCALNVQKHQEQKKKNIIYDIVSELNETICNISLVLLKEEIALFSMKL